MFADRLICLAVSIVAVFGCSLGIGTTHATAEIKSVYLTFDDGPSKFYTPQILDILHGEHVKATFFVLGFRSQQLPQIVRRIHTEGHEIGNHGFYHERITQKSETWLRTDVAKADASIRAACGVTPKYFRPPGGIINQYDAKIVNELGHSVALWTLDTHDWDASSPSSIIRAVKTGAQPNAIILMHDGVSSSRHTVQALPSIIHFLRSSGYTFKILDMQS